MGNLHRFDRSISYCSHHLLHGHTLQINDGASGRNEVGQKRKGDNFMKIRNLKTKVIGPILLSLPMTCMHLGDDHHGDHHSSIHQQSVQSSVHGHQLGRNTGQDRIMIQQDSDGEK